MRFEKIGSFKEMTKEAMQKINGGVNGDTLKTPTTKVTYVGTATTCGSGSMQNADPCTLQDIGSVSQD